MSLRTIIPTNETFILKLWYRKSEPPQYKGLLHHVSTGQSTTVHDLKDLVIALGPFLGKDTGDSAPENDIESHLK